MARPQEHGPSPEERSHGKTIPIELRRDSVGDGYALDINGRLKLEFKIDQNGAARPVLHIQEDNTPEKLSGICRDDPFVKNVFPLLRLEAQDLSGHNHTKALTLTLDHKPLAEFRAVPYSVTLYDSLRKLCVFDLRRLGTSPKQPDVLPRVLDEYIKRLDHFAPTTDLHTHLSTQVRADDLIEIGKRHGTLYPLSKIRQFNKRSPGAIPYSMDGQGLIPRRVFLPLAHVLPNQGGMEPAIPLTSISPKGIEFLKSRMQLSPWKQNTFGNMESCYSPREPFTKNIDLLPDILWKVAENYKKQNVTYAELTSTEVFKPEWLAVIHKVLPDIEKPESEGGLGVQLRFKAGLPRNLSKKDIARRVEQYKQIAISPYIVGADVIGYELNKTNNMLEELKQLGAWMRDNQPDDILQIHAGENNKNPENVREALQIASQYDIRLHLGHSLYGVDTATLRLAKEMSDEGKLIVQFNLDSNLALNNIDMPSDVSMKLFLDRGIASVLGTDGADAYQTSARQLAIAALYCGLSPEDFEKMHNTEREYVARQRAIFNRKSREFEAKREQFEAKSGRLYFDPIPSPPAPAATATAAVAYKDPKEFVWAEDRQKKKLEELHTKLSSKRPIFFGGAGGKSWAPISAASRYEIQTGLDALLEELNPNNFYIVKGRTKAKDSVNHEVEEAVERYNSNPDHPQKFHCVTLESESKVNGNSGAQKAPSEYFHVVQIDVPLMNLASAQTEFLKDRKGFAFYIGGKGFTRDFILMSQEMGLHYGMMLDANGASAEKARLYPEHAFKGAHGMVEYARKEHLLGLEARGQDNAPSKLNRGETLFGYFFYDRPQQAQQK